MLPAFAFTPELRAAPAALAFTLGEDAARTVAHLPGDLPPGSIIHSDLDLRLPPDLPPGVYPLRLSAAQVGTLTVAPRAASWNARCVPSGLQDGSRWSKSPSVICRAGPPPEGTTKMCL